MIEHEIPLFPVCLKKIEGFISDQQAADIFEFCALQHASNHPLLSGKHCSSFSEQSNVLRDIQTNLPSCPDLLSRVQQAVVAYENTVGLHENKVANSWFNFQKSGSTLKQHVHPNSLLTGALFIKVDENSSGLYFENPNPFASYGIIEKTYTHYTHQWVKFKPKIGDLFVFPSWLRHGSMDEVNYTEDRLVISFNTSLRQEN